MLKRLLAQAEEDVAELHHHIVTVSVSWAELCWQEGRSGTCPTTLHQYSADTVSFIFEGPVQIAVRLAILLHRLTSLRPVTSMAPVGGLDADRSANPLATNYSTIAGLDARRTRNMLRGQQEQLLDLRDSRGDFGKILHDRRIVTREDQFRAGGELLHPVLRP